MPVSTSIYKRVEDSLPSFYKTRIRQNMIYAGIEMNYKEWIGFFFLYSIGTGLTTIFVLFLFTSIEIHNLILILIGVFIAFQLISELLLTLSKRYRTIFIEGILPDVLSLISSNVKSGMTIDQSLLLSTRDEFGGFKNELIKASKETLAGKTLGEALMGISSLIDSKLFRKTVNLIVEGINSGGELSKLLENIAEDIRSMNVLRKEIRAGILMYVLILFIASGFGAPLLFGVSLYEVQMLTQLTSMIPETSAPSAVTFLSFESVNIDISILRIVMITALLINSVFGALMIGILETGSAKDGVKNIPLLIFLSMGVFILSNHLVSSLLG